MRLIHTSDLHLGKRVNGFSMLEDQEYILNQIAYIIESEKADALVIAGDVYDGPMPPEGAVNLLDRFITRVSSLCQIFIIAGNHDSAERLAFGNKILGRQGVHISDAYSGRMQKVVCHDVHGDLNVYMLPYIRPSIVRPFFEDCEINTPDDAMAVTMEATGVNYKERNILIAHQFVVGKGIELSTTDSEVSVFSVGGVDCISAEYMEPFDYVALGHIHRTQPVRRDNIRYSGSPLKYSKSEVRDTKVVCEVDVGVKGEVSVKDIPLVPRREMRRIRGTIEELLSWGAYSQGDTDDYMFVTLTKETMDAKVKLNAIYPHVMEVVTERLVKQSDRGDTPDVEKIRGMTPLELFTGFYEKMNNRTMTEEQEEYFLEVFDSVTGGDRQ